MNEVTKPRVLLVDDDASLLKLLAIRIESKGRSPKLPRPARGAPFRLPQLEQNPG